SIYTPCTNWRATLSVRPVVCPRVESRSVRSSRYSTHGLPPRRRFPERLPRGPPGDQKHRREGTFPDLSGGGSEGSLNLGMETLSVYGRKGPKCTSRNTVQAIVCKARQKTPGPYRSKIDLSKTSHRSIPLLRPNQGGEPSPA